MGTRGLWGFKNNSSVKFTYSHYDSYIDCLGIEIVDLINQSKTKDELLSIYKRLKQHFSEELVSEKEYLSFKKNGFKIPKDVNENNINNLTWYTLLREYQTEPKILLNKKFKHILNFNADFFDVINNQVNQYEYVYIIDLQDDQLYVLQHNDLYKSIKLDKIFELDIEFPDNEKYKEAKLMSVF